MHGESDIGVERFMYESAKNVKKNDSDFFTNENREIEAGRQVFIASRSLDEHEQASEIAHISGLCAAFWPPKGAISHQKQHVDAREDDPREKKSMPFFHADISFL